MITFISPCLLPMLPVYVSYFAGRDDQVQSGKHTRSGVLINALGFVAGFTVVFIILGAFAGTIGSFLMRHRTVVDIVTGLLVVVFGLIFLDVIRIPALTGVSGKGFGGGKHNQKRGFLSAMLFGMIFSVGWTPCVGAFLGSALMLAASSGESVKGVLMLLTYSLGLGIPFVASALLIDKLKGTFDFIKKHYGVVQKVSGGFLIVIGMLMATGLFGKLLAALAI